MGIDHSCSDVDMTEQLLNSSDVITRFQKMSRKTVPQRMYRSPLGSARLLNSGLEFPLENKQVLVMPSNNKRAGDRLEALAGGFLVLHFTSYRRHRQIRGVKERIAELEWKNAELERMNHMFVGWELRMVELK